MAMSSRSERLTVTVSVSGFGAFGSFCSVINRRVPEPAMNEPVPLVTETRRFITEQKEPKAPKPETELFPALALLALFVQ
jgi:hypothetical protein